MISTEMVLEKSHEGTYVVLFDYNDPDWTRQSSIALDKDVWVEMGSPDVVTVTVQPGDHLND